MKALQQENLKLIQENKNLNEQNEQFNKIIETNTRQTIKCEVETDEVAGQLTQLIHEYEAL